jgi:glycosyltransferase involved in cell wall biosynthesis
MSSRTQKPRLVCFVNGIFADQFGGGDIYLAYVIRAAIAAGYPVHFFGGHALKRYLERMNFPPNHTATDDAVADLGNTNQLGGQFRLLFDFARRLRGTLRQLEVVQENDLAYAMSDYWFDTIPLMRCRARAKILYLGMMAPTLGQIILKTRADVTPTRLASIYYWLSQQMSLRLFRFCKRGIVTYSHPEMRDYLLRFGYREEALAYVPNGSDVEIAERVPPQAKQFDVAWTGRVHPQKGIDDLLALLQQMSARMPDFRAVIIGKSKDALEPKVREMGIAQNVTFSGLVSEEEKFRLLKASRVFAMPSRYESWGIVVGEALAAGVPVVAYDLTCYRPVFGDFVRYAKPFERDAWLNAVEYEIKEQRAGRNYLAAMNLAKLNRALSWKSAQESFVQVLEKVSDTG